MKSNYKKIGEHIRLVDERNKGLQGKQLLGLSISKQFIPSVANIIGTDMENYKIIRRNQFACSTMQVRRDKKMPVALLQEVDEAIISQAYPIFEVKNEKELLPEYLMMWFTRSEFDREACFHAVGGVRGSLEWEDFENLQFPIPHPDKQKEIVKEYNTIVNRITLNNQLIKKLEETAQAIYREWFVDFEFPNEEGKPYKSNGGEMVESELGAIPKGWKVKAFTAVVKLGGGGTPDTTDESYWNGEFPFFTPADISKGYYCIETEKFVSKLGLKNSSTKLYPKDTVFVTARGTVGAIAIAGCEMTMNQSCYALSGVNPFFIHQVTIAAIQKLNHEAIGAVFSALVTKDFDEQFIVQPKQEIEIKFQNQVKEIYNLILIKTKENKSLISFRDLLLSKLATIEN